ncbi:VCBS repeat-containing protein [uncultured Desulfosarcina sp.]|uniref:VCBS repeat-containing protein n=1 Tax=uncultured Desulfosarcina sp. TaxID=218289 RepID=UPI0029C75657|nr:VCBS repeat-containing protein [uncultured Desulfosarcina sp.]
MKNPSYRLIRNTLLTLFSLLLLFAAAPALAAPARVAILPFDVHAEKDMTFLQEGILDMLGSRLAWQDKVEVINKSETKAALASVEGFDGQSRALLVGGKLQADYVLFGSLTVFGESVSIDAKMVDVSGRQAPLPFFAQTRGMGEVIPQINQFATTINTSVFGREVAQRPTAAPAPQTGNVAAPQVQPASQAQNPRMHPEKILISGGTQSDSTPIIASQADTPNPAFLSTAPAGAVGGGSTTWKSRNFKKLITGLDVGDVDNDGFQEVVLLTDKLVSIYRMQNGQFLKVAETAPTRTSTYIGVDIGDVNGNGIPEIYVSSLGPNKNTVDSFVLEYTGKEYNRIYGPDNWYYRIARTIDHGVVLLGQRQLTADNSVFTEAVHEMIWQGSSIVPGTRLLSGGKTNLIGGTYGDATNSGNSQILAYDSSDRLRLYSGPGEADWEDSDISGGNLLFYTPRKTEPGYEKKIYYPMRVRITDIDRDGKAEIMIASHEDRLRNMLENQRSFNKAHLECLQWDGVTFASQWKTQTVKGRIADFKVADYDNDGQDELLIALVTKEGAAIFTDSISRLIGFDLNQQ